MVQANFGHSWEKVKFQENRGNYYFLFVDDSAMMGKEKVLDKKEKDLKTYFTVTEEEKFNYVGCDYIVTSKGITPTTAGYKVGGINEGDKRVSY